MPEAAELLRALVTAIADGVGDDEGAGIDAAIKAFDTDALDVILLETIGMADMAGDLMLREGDPLKPSFVALAADGGVSDARVFVDLPWLEAVEEFRKRGAVTPRDLERLIRDIATRSQEARKKLLQFVQDKAHEKLANVIHDGGSYRDFAEGLRDETIPLGINPDDDHYLKMVFRTNVQGAYSSGRDRASKDPDIIEQRPIAQYLTVGDAFTRPEHAKFAEANGGGFYVIGSDEWEAARPPPKGSPWNCRCSFVTLYLEQAREAGYTG